MMTETPEKLKTASKLLNDFNAFVDNRSTVFLVDLPELFPNFWEWHFSIWEREYQLLSKKDKRREWSTHRELSRALDSILKKVEERTLKEGDSYSFFLKFKDHVEEYREKFVEGEGNKKFYYIDSIIPIFYTTLVENIKNSPEGYDIWHHYFPTCWKITKETYKEQEDSVPKVLFREFFRWAQRRICDSTDKFDEVLDEIASNLFPSVERILWAKLLTLLMRPWPNNNRMKSLVEQGTNFGFASRMGNYVSAEQSLQELHDKDMESQENATMDLALCLFPREFTMEKVEDFISELGSPKLKYDAESREESRRKNLFRIFDNYLKSKEK